VSSDAAYSVTLKKLQKALSLELVTADDEDRLENILVTSPEVNRPGLQLVGYLEYFGTDRIQMIGKVYSRLDEFFKCGFPCMVVARGLEVLTKEIAERTREHGVLVEVFGEGILILGESPQACGG